MKLTESKCRNGQSKAEVPRNSRNGGTHVRALQEVQDKMLTTTELAVRRTVLNKQKCLATLHVYMQRVQSTHKLCVEKALSALEQHLQRWAQH